LADVATPNPAAIAGLVQKNIKQPDWMWITQCNGLPVD